VVPVVVRRVVWFEPAVSPVVTRLEALVMDGVVERVGQVEGDHGRDEYRAKPPLTVVRMRTERAFDLLGSGLRLGLGN
jgi:hypothetical protein